MLFRSAFGALAAGRLRERRKTALRPLLWTQLGFGGALLVGFLQLGVPFGVYGALVPVVTGDPSRVDMLVIGIGGMLFGTLCILLIWSSVRLGELGRRRPA